MAIENDVLIFKEDAVFSSLSAAASIVLGMAVSGTGAWKNKFGTNYKAVKDAVLK